MHVVVQIQAAEPIGSMLASPRAHGQQRCTAMHRLIICALLHKPAPQRRPSVAFVVLHTSVCDLQLPLCLDTETTPCHSAACMQRPAAASTCQQNPKHPLHTVATPSSVLPVLSTSPSFKPTWDLPFYLWARPDLDPQHCCPCLPSTPSLLVLPSCLAHDPCAGECIQQISFGLHGLLLPTTVLEAQHRG